MKILRFNESSDELKNQLREKLTEIRDVFAEFEDMNIISYNVVPSGYQWGAYATLDNGTDLESFLDRVTQTVSLGIKPGNSNSKKTLLGKRIKDLSDKNVCVISNIKIVGEETNFGTTVINNEGIKLFDDILSANSRLIDMGYDVKLDLNSNHRSYKPVIFLIYFNI